MSTFISLLIDQNGIPKEDTVYVTNGISIKKNADLEGRGEFQYRKGSFVPIPPHVF